MRNLAFTAISTAVVAVGLSSTPASAFTSMANPRPDYALPDGGYVGGESADASGNYGRTWLQTRGMPGDPGSPSRWGPELPRSTLGHERAWCGCF
jgi:hypothetical protein